MKKLFVIVLAAIGMVSCMNTDEVIEVSNGDAIAFADAFIENSVRATAYDNGNLNHFNVWGTVTAGQSTAPIFKGTEVTKANGVWSYDGATQYWVKGVTYNFRALVDGTTPVVVDDMLTGVYVDITEQEDVLVAEDMDITYDGSKQYVEFQFAHILSKVKFTFDTTIANDAYTYTISNVQIADKAIAAYDIASKTWSGHDGAATITFAQLTDEMFLIPSDKEKTISFDVTLKLGTVELSKETKTVKTDVELEAGHAYNFTVVLGEPGEPIKFTATVQDWTPGGDQAYVPGTVNVSSAASFAEKFVDANVGEITLISDIDLDELAALTRAEGDDVKLTVSAGESLSINLNGHKLSATSAQSGNRELFLVKGNLTVKNGTIEYAHTGENMGWGAMTTIFDVTAGGVLNLEGVTAKNLGGSDMNFVAHLNNWGEVTLNVENSTLESTYVPVRVFNSGPDMNNVTIKNSTLKGNSAAFWVHNYTVEDFGTQAKADAQKALLNFEIYNNGNTFSPDVNGIRYGFTNSVRTDAYGITKTVSEDGTEVILGSIVEDGLIRRGVAGDEKNTTIKKAVVGEGVTTLYDRTFRCFYALETVELPSTLTTIGAAGSGVFQSCSALKNIVIPESVTVLGKGTFQECAALESINIPAGVTRIEENCLRNTGLKSVEFHEGVTYFGAQAFRDCKQLKEVIIKAPNFTVEANAFGVMAGALPDTKIYVANAEMKAYLENTLAYKNQFEIVGPAEVSDAASFAEAVAAGYPIIDATGAEIEGAKFNVKGATVIGATFVNAATSNTVNGTFKGCTFTGSNGLRYGYAGETAVFEDCVFDGKTYGIHFDGGANDVIFKNCTISGFNGLGDELTMATFENCTFVGNGKSGYNGANLWGSAKLINCEFTFDGSTANEWIDCIGADKTYEFVNCTINGVAYTPANYTEYDAIFSRNNATVKINGVDCAL